jgi:hypothetical protein
MLSNMKKYLKIFIPLSIIGASVTSCKKSFLNENPPSAYTPNAITDSLGFRASLVGLYNNYSNLLTYSNSQGWLSVWQVGTDVANATNNQEGIEIPFYNYAQLTSTSGGPSVMWSKQYVLINLANTIISSIQSDAVTGISEAGKRAISAEAKFFRAYAYNTLATLFGDVPLVTEPVTAPKTNYTRTPIAQVNALVEEDLLYAGANLPDVPAVGAAPTSRANKYMAMQLLAEAYLRMGKNAEAETQAQNIINSGKFSLITARFGTHSSSPGDYYNDQFWYGSQRRKQGNTETIWTLEQENPTALVGGNTDNSQHRRVWGAAYHNRPGMVIADSLGGRALGRLRLSNWVLYNLYEQGDIRNSEWNIRRKYTYNDRTKATFGQPVPYTGPDTLFILAPHTTKWYQFDPKDEFGYAMIKDFIIMRLGETYLLLAEAQFKQGKLQAAADNINVLRQRAFGANYPAKGKVEASQITLDFILDERVRELVGEENRRMTLMRTKKLVERATKLNSGDAQRPLTGLTATHLLLPIPLTEIQLNKDAVLEQNPGYN